MKRDIFHGKIKKEYFSYILVYMIFFLLLLVGVGVLCVCAAIWGMKSNSMGERLLIAAFGAVALVLAAVYLFLELLVIRRFPKYERIRRALFNSDRYFTESNSDEYYGRNRRGDKAAFELVGAFAEAEKGMGSKHSARYTVYVALVIAMSVLGLADLAVMPMLYEKGVALADLSDGEFALCYFLVAIMCIALAVFFLARAFRVAITAPLEQEQWRYELYNALVGMAVRKNNKKLKFWYTTDQLDRIEDLVKSASDHTELKLETQGNKPVRFFVVDTADGRVVFTGWFV
ncbi:MAG: hypothetical protein IJ363_13215 [Clostridia bacterium]|nr:hypothetical protein [Clostridia bacterium]